MDGGSNQRKQGRGPGKSPVPGINWTVIFLIFLIFWLLERENIVVADEERIDQGERKPGKLSSAFRYRMIFSVPRLIVH